MISICMLRTTTTSSTSEPLTSSVHDSKVWRWWCRWFHLAKRYSSSSQTSSRTCFDKINIKYLFEGLTTTWFLAGSISTSSWTKTSVSQLRMMSLIFWSQKKEDMSRGTTWHSPFWSLPAGEIWVSKIKISELFFVVEQTLLWWCSSLGLLTWITWEESSWWWSRRIMPTVMLRRWVDSEIRQF